MEEKIATAEERVQLAKDVLQQLAAGSLCGVPPANWFIGFPVVTAIPFFDSKHLSIDDFGDRCLSTYDVDDEDHDKYREEHWVVGSRGERTDTGGQPDSLLDTDLQEVLAKLPMCEVCAVGSLVVAAAKRHDNMKIVDLEKSGVFTVMAPYFEYGQLLLIEMAYEQSHMGVYEHTREEADAAMQMWPDVPTGSRRLKLIMENIIENNGTFVTS